MRHEKLILIVTLLALVAAAAAVVLFIEEVTYPPEIQRAEILKAEPTIEETIRGHEYGTQRCMEATEHIWGDLNAAGFHTRILAGRIGEAPVDAYGINHVWLTVEESPGHWVQVEATAGKVIPEEYADQWHAMLTFEDPEEMWTVYRAGPKALNTTLY